MIKIATFKATDFQKANEFIEKYGSNAKGGVSINNGEIYVFYNDGKMTQGYATNLLNSELGDQKAQLITAEENYEYYVTEMALCERIKPKKPENWEMLPKDAQKEWKSDMNKYEDIKSNLDQSMTLAQGNLAGIKKKIASLEAHIKKVEKGEVVY